jgi:hypothetical protein
LGHEDPGHKNQTHGTHLGEIKLHLNDMNREEVFYLSKSWKLLLQALKE